MSYVGRHDDDQETTYILYDIYGSLASYDSQLSLSRPPVGVQANHPVWHEPMGDP
jgi:hypothetical protein